MVNIDAWVFPRPRQHQCGCVGIPSSKATSKPNAWVFPHPRQRSSNHMSFHLCWLLLLNFWVKGSRFPKGSPRRSYPSYWSFVEYIEFIESNVHCHLYFRNSTLSLIQTREVKSHHILWRHTIHIYFQGRPSYATSHHVTRFPVFAQ